MIRRRASVTELLDAWQAGDRSAGDAALGLVYGELQRLARQAMRREGPGHTLPPTALVHEAWLRLVGSAPPSLDGRGHLLAVVTRLMRQILVNSARDWKARKRGGGRRREPLEDAVDLYEARCRDLVALHDALEALGDRNIRQAQIVDLRFFGGLTIPEIADVLNCSVRTVEREWTEARGWLYTEVVA